MEKQYVKIIVSLDTPGLWAYRMLSYRYVNKGVDSVDNPKDVVF